MNKLYITKVLPDGYALGVIPEMEKPVSQTDKILSTWDIHLASLPTFLIHPSLNPKEGEWIEQWREGYQRFIDGTNEWVICEKIEYDAISWQIHATHRRIVLLPLEKQRHWLEVFKDAWYKDNNSLPKKRMDELWKDIERIANMAYKFIRREHGH